LLRPRPEQEQPLAARRAGGVQLGQRAALYCRVSTADQSCERQERDLTAFAARAGYEVVGVFRETGSGARADRVERRRAMALAQRREIDAVLVTELSRWGRGTLDLLHTFQELEARRVSVIAMSGLAFDLSTPHGRMLATVVAGIAEFERELIRERVRSGMAAAKARGKKLGPQLPPGRPRARAEQEHRRRHRQAEADGARLVLIGPAFPAGAAKPCFPARSLAAPAPGPDGAAERRFPRRCLFRRCDCLLAVASRPCCRPVRHNENSD
jgi:DNA invertase Pin-like site-specific DNA recombinase